MRRKVISAFTLLLQAITIFGILTVAGASFAHAQAIHTFAGGGPSAGSSALSASLGKMYGMAADSLGNIYVVSVTQFRVLKLAPDGTISAAAGSGAPGYFGDGGPATSAGFVAPSAVAVDSAGNLYIADVDACVIRMVSASGTITTIAGDGVGGYGGDGGPATSAMLQNPMGVAVDGAGNIYIGDQLNHVVRKVTPSGTISTFAGNGTGGYAGDGGLATSAKLDRPAGVATDASGNVYIADSGNFVIRKVDTSGVITTVAGNGTGGYTGDGGPATSAEIGSIENVAVDATGNLYIADWFFNVIRQVTTAGTIFTIAGNGTAGFSGDGGQATSAELNFPWAVTVDSTGDLYVEDANNYVVRKVVTSGALSTISTVAGNFRSQYSGDGAPAAGAELNQPRAISIDGAGNMYVADMNNNVIRKITPAGIISTIAGNGTQGYSGDGGAAVGAALNQPIAAVADNSGNIYIAEFGNFVVRKVTSAGTISTIAGNGTQGYSGDGGPATSAQLNSPSGLAVDAAGNLYISDSGAYVVRKVTPGGIISTYAGNGTSGYSGDGGLAINAELAIPEGLAIDGTGSLYIADLGGEIRKVAPLGAISTVAGGVPSGIDSGNGDLATSAHVEQPIGVALDSSGNMYIAEWGGQSVRVVNASGIIDRLAGSPSLVLGFAGDGGPALDALFHYPAGVAVDASGNVYVSDYDNERIRVITVPALGLSLGSIPFPDQAVNQPSSPQSVTVANNSNLPVNITSISITGTNAGDFSYTTTCGASLAQQSHCSISVSFTPSAQGSRTATLNIAANGNPPQTVTLSGNGVYPVASLSASAVAFPDQAQGQPSTPQTLTLSNPSTVPLSITGISITGADPGDFSQTNNCGSSLPAGGSCVISVTFTPTVLGPRSAILGFSDDAQSPPQTVTLSGNGVQLGIVPALSNLNLPGSGGVVHDSLKIEAGEHFHGPVYFTCEVKFTGQGEAHHRPLCFVEPELLFLAPSSDANATLTVRTGSDQPWWDDDHDHDHTTPGNYLITVTARHGNTSTSTVIELTVQ